MATILEILTTNYDGQIADITFYPCSGGSIRIGGVTLPYDYETEDYYGTYDIYLPNYNKTCSLNIPCPPPTEFISVWRTTGAIETVTLPYLASGSIYSGLIDWGDGTTSANSYDNRTHTYTGAGDYTITIDGFVSGFSFVNAGDKLKLREIKHWGNKFSPNNNNGTFFGCSNLVLTGVTGVPNLTSMSSLNNFFRSCLSLTTVANINTWNTSSITNMSQTFDSCILFNDNISNWNTSNVNTFFAMFAHDGAFNNGGSPYINNWDTANVTNMRFMFGADGSVPGGTVMNFNQPIGNWNTSKVTNFSSMFNRAGLFNQDISTKIVTKNEILYTAWDTLNATDMSFMLSSVPIFGQFNQNIGNWNTSKVTSLNSMFQGQGEINQDLSTKVVTVGEKTYIAWDTLNATDLRFMFSAGVGNTGKFNQNISNWNTSKVISLSSFAFNQPLFNQDISTKIVTVSGITYTAWSTSNVTTMLSSFATNTAPTFGTFNQNIGNWNTSKVTSLNTFMFNQPLFNQDISTKVVTVGGSTYTAWNTSNVTTMSFIFGGVTGFTGQFNQNISNWNTTKVTNINSIFQNNSYFNQDISTKSVTVSGITYTAWSTSNVTTMRYSFFNNLTNPISTFNQNIGSWDTAKVIDMTAMLYNRPNFNQNLGNWNVSLVNAFNGTGTALSDTFADYNGLSQTNYNSLLIGWASRPVLANKIINFGTANYTSGATASRLTLTSSPNNWTIVDGGLI